MDKEIKIVAPATCEKCGKPYGKCNAKYKDCELWIACDCQPDHLIYFVNKDSLVFKKEE